MQEPYIQTTVPLTELVEEQVVSPEVPIYTPRIQKKFPILISLLLILLAFIAAICVYLFIQIRTLNTQLTATPSPLPTPVASVVADDGWQTYVNQDLKISFDYPREWKFDTQAVSDTGTPIYILSANDSIFRIDTFVDDSATIAQYLVKQDKVASTAWEGTPSLTVKSTKKTIIGEYSVIQRVENMNAAGFSLLATYFKYKNVIYRVTIENSIAEKVNEDFNSKDQQIYNKILSTIQFGDNLSNQTSYTCPKSEWVDCMPTPDVGIRLECTPEYMSWATKNCPDFKGAAL